jgi:hypothetical protein
MFQTRSILEEAARRLNVRGNLQAEQMLLTFWHDLFRTGHIAWGYNLDNAEPPFCHLTDHGRKALSHLSRDPMNRDGYLDYVHSLVALGDIPLSYITEALQTYAADCYKATAVLVGGAAESVALELRETLVARMEALGHTVPKNLRDWRIARVLSAIREAIEAKKQTMPKSLYEAFDSNWPAFTYQIRTTRNEVGHPNSVEPVTAETVHAALLIFPELAKLTSNLREWIDAHYA